MAPVSVNVAPALRPWRGAGVTCLLLSAEAAATLRESAKGSGRATSSGTGISSGAASGPGTGTAVRSPARPPQRTPAPAANAPAPKPRTDPGQPGSRELSPTWASLWEQMSAASPRPQAVWTYAELGTDLRGQASAARRAVLQGLIAALHMPRGSHAFWPYCLPADNLPELDMFFTGLARFRPSSVLLLGDRAATDFALAGTMPSGPLQDCLCRGYRFVRLPDMDAIAAMAPPARNRLIAFVRTILS